MTTGDLQRATEEPCGECGGDGCDCCGDTGFLYTLAETERQVAAEDNSSHDPSPSCPCASCTLVRHTLGTFS